MRHYRISLQTSVQIVNCLFTYFVRIILLCSTVELLHLAFVCIRQQPVIALGTYMTSVELLANSVMSDRSNVRVQLSIWFATFITLPCNFRLVNLPFCFFGDIVLSKVIKLLHFTGENLVEQEDHLREPEQVHDADGQQHRVHQHRIVG